MRVHVATAEKAADAALVLPLRARHIPSGAGSWRPETTVRGWRTKPGTRLAGKSSGLTSESLLCDPTLARETPSRLYREALSDRTITGGTRRSESARNAGEETEIAYSSPAQIADATP